MSIKYLTQHYDVYYKGEKLDNILEMDYEVVASTVGGEPYVEIDITYIDRYNHLKHITTLSDYIKFEKKESD